jgi:hypothetical protein
MGHKPPRPPQAGVTGLPPIAAAPAIRHRGSSGPIPTKLHRSNLALFDHVVSGSEQSLGDVQSERLSGFEIYHKLEFGWLLNRKIAWLFASQNTIHIRAQPLD